MAKDKVIKRLTTIVSVDVAGYSRLMEVDEAGTLAALKAHRKVTDPKITEHRGRIVGTAGDGILIEFPSVSDAVSSAVEVQSLMAERNADVPADTRMQFRIGINLGDVMIEADDIFGTGVNVAARLQELAEPGGICVSRSVFNQVKAMGELGFADLGPQKVKNITEPVPAYRVLLDPSDAGRVLPKKRAVRARSRLGAGLAAAVLLLVAAGMAWWQPWVTRVEPARLAKMAFPLPKKPSIAVLPFNNLSGDKKQDYLADGLSENIISTLSKVPKMFVIARNSTFTYKGKPVKVQRVAEELGVQYVLEGSVQKSGDRIRVTAQLIDAITGRHLWSERYDRKLTELFTVQDEITKKIVVALQVQLNEGEQARIRQRATKNLQAWSHVVRGLALFRRYTKADNAAARQQFKRAIELDPDYAWAWAMLGWSHMIEVRLGFTRDYAAAIKRAAEAANKAAALDDTLPDAHSLSGILNWLRGKYDKALVQGRRAIALDPNAAEMHAVLSIITRSVGDWDKTIALSKRAMRLHPQHPSWYLLELSRGHTFKGEYDRAIAAAEKGLRRAESNRLKGRFHANLAFAHIEAGRKEEARRHMAEAQRLHTASAVWYRNYLRFKNPAHLERMLTALRKAGLPEGTPPLPKKPSIAVLPFTNLSGDKDQEYFADGMTDDLITGLSKVSGLIVVSRTSAFTFKGKKVKIKDIARTLGVRYVLEGSVRRAGGKVRINAQLIDATTGGHVWADTFDRDYTRIFDLQDEVKGKIVQALKVKLTPKERTALKRKPTRNLKAYDLYLKAEKLRLTFSSRKYRAAFALYDKALALDPDFIDAHVGNARASFRAWRLGWLPVIFPPKAKVQAQRSLTTALALDPDNAEALALQSRMQLYLQKHDLAVALARGAVLRHPENASVRSQLARVLLASDRLDEARTALKRALELAPKPSAELLLNLASDYLMLGEAKRAVPLLLRARKAGGSKLIASGGLANAYARLGDMKQAKAEFETFRMIWPWASAAWFRVSFAHYRNKRLLEDYINAWLKAGMPEWPYGFKGRAEHRLRNAELQALYRGRPTKEIGTHPRRGRYEAPHDGKGNVTAKMGGGLVVGTSMIERDMLCFRVNTNFMRRKYCGEVYRNPKGSPQTNDEYVRINLYGKWRFSVKPLEKP